MSHSDEHHSLDHESKALREAWMRHEDAFLKDYLVSSVEDPRIHFPSILSRGLAAELLFPGRCRELIWEEYRFGICMSYIQRVFQQRPSMGTGQLLRRVLEEGGNAMDSLPVPTYVHEAWRHLNGLSDPQVHYMAQCLDASTAPGGTQLPAKALGVLQDRWKAVLQEPSSKILKVMEPACGSANDYRGLHAIGLHRHLDYRGFDICPKNIANARELFPDTTFSEGNIFKMDAEDRSQDYVFVHDLFEHLSLEGMECGLREVCRVTRDLACLCFFNMAERSEHLVQARDGYHWNRLSLEKTCSFLRPLCRDLQVIHVSSFLGHAFGCHDYHNPGAYVLILECGDE